MNIIQWWKIRRARLKCEAQIAEQQAKDKDEERKAKLRESVKSIRFNLSESGFKPIAGSNDRGSIGEFYAIGPNQKLYLVSCYASGGYDIERIKNDN